jgi:hypothetical protein
LASNQIGRALSPGTASFTPASSVIKPDDALILSLTPQVRERLYLELTRDQANFYAINPYRLAKGDFEKWGANHELRPEILKEIQQLSYERGGLLLFSDYPLVLKHLKDDAERIAFAQTISRQPAVLVRLFIRPQTDVEKVLGYWSRGVQLKDARPLLNAVKRLDGGGTVSLLYMLPPRAREKLNTFPYPDKSADQILNCHWSTMNFFREIPDNSLANPTNMLGVLERDYYRVGKPSEYGDVMLIRNAQNEILHSALYLAEDLVITKNGKTANQPWVICRIGQVINEYTYNYLPKVEYYRNRGY